MSASNNWAENRAEAAAKPLPGDTDLAFASIEEMSCALSSGQITSLDLVDLYFSRIERIDPKLHAYAQVLEQGARQAARAADERRALGRRLGPLHGIPAAVKDIFDIAGHTTGAGSKALGGKVAEVSATAVRQLEDAGMVVLGKTHMVEFAFGGWGTNLQLGTPRNPWDPEVHRVPGGSSSGSAVAVAAGLAPAALGTDTGGSVRTPACWCGVVGMKTSQGLIGRDGVVPLCPTHDTVGVLTRTVRDAALLLETLADVDPETYKAPQISPLAEIEAGIEGLRLGVLSDADLAGVESEVGDLFNAAVKDMEVLGARLEKVRLPVSIQDCVRDGGEIMSAESYAHLGKYVESPDSLVDPIIRERILRGRDISASNYVRLLEARRLAQAELAFALQGLDAFLAPTCPTTAIPVAEVDEYAAPNVLGRFVNYLDLASLSVPIGFVRSGLPAGMQIVARRFDDALVLRIGRAFERMHGILVRRPPEP